MNFGIRKLSTRRHYMLAAGIGLAVLAAGISTGLGLQRSAHAQGTGSISVTLDTQPDSSDDFGFTTTGAGLSPFTLDDDSDATLPNSTTFSQLDAGSYSVTGPALPGWTLLSLSCDRGATPSAASPLTPSGVGATANINLGEGESLACTFSYQRVSTETGSLTVVKQVVNDDEGTALPGDFSLHVVGANGDVPNSPAPGSASGTVYALDPGAYTVSEAAATGYSASFSGDCGADGAVTVAAGQSLTCTVTNDDNPVGTGSITIVKDATPKDGTDFTFTTSGFPDNSGFALDNDSDATLPDSMTFSNLPAGQYSVTEEALDGWTLQDVTCTGAARSLAAQTPIENTIDISLGDGANVICTFINQADRVTGTSSITIIKDAGDAAGSLAGFTTTGGLDFDMGFSLDDDPATALANTRTFDTLPAGPYTITEEPAAGWALNAVTCRGGGTSVNLATGTVTVDLADGADVTCTYINAPAETVTGSITIVKDAGDAANSEVAFTTTGGLNGDAGFSLDDDPATALAETTTFSDLAAGTYTVTETANASWTLDDLTCDNAAGSGDVGTATATITLAAGDNVTCTFVNAPAETGTGSITIVKNADPADGTDFSFVATGLGTDTFQLDDDGGSDATLPDSMTFSDLAAGTYTVGEEELTGWTLTAINCTGGNTLTPQAVPASNTITIDLAEGANVTCTFENAASTAGTGSITIVKDAGDAASSEVAFTTTGGLNGDTGFSLDDDPATALDNTTTFSDLAAGTYTVTETANADWTLNDLTCDNAAGSGDVGTATATISIAAGENVTCTFVNTAATTTVPGGATGENGPGDQGENSQGNNGNQFESLADFFSSLGLNNPDVAGFLQILFQELMAFMHGAGM